jgi:hypothetical protein
LMGAGLESLQPSVSCLGTAPHPRRALRVGTSQSRLEQGRWGRAIQGHLRASRAQPPASPQPGPTHTPVPQTSGADELARVPLPGLTALALDEPRIPDECWPRLLAAPWAPRLRRLSLALWNNSQGDGHGAWQRALERAPLPALVDLETEGTNIRPGMLTAAPWLSQLTRLQFTVEWLGTAGLAALASLPLGRLECLSLTYVHTTEAGLVALGAAPWLTQLTRLKVLDSPSVLNRGEETMDVAACDRLLDGRGAGNPFAPLARAGVIEKHLG